MGHAGLKLLDNIDQVIARRDIQGSTGQYEIETAKLNFSKGE